MAWGSSSSVRKAQTIAQTSDSSTDKLLAILIEEVTALRQELAEERKAADTRRTQESRRGR